VINGEKVDGKNWGLDLQDTGGYMGERLDKGNWVNGGIKGYHKEWGKDLVW